MTDPQLRQEVATAVERNLSANPPGDSSVDGVEAAFAAVTMRTAESVIPPQERGRPADPFNDWGGGRGCNKFVPVLGGNGTKTAPTGDVFD